MTAIMVEMNLGGIEGAGAAAAVVTGGITTKAAEEASAMTGARIDVTMTTTGVEEMTEAATAGEDGMVGMRRMVMMIATLAVMQGLEVEVAAAWIVTATAISGGVLPVTAALPTLMPMMQMATYCAVSRCRCLSGTHVMDRLLLPFKRQLQPLLTVGAGMATTKRTPKRMRGVLTLAASSKSSEGAAAAERRLLASAVEAASPRALLGHCLLALVCLRC